MRISVDKSDPGYTPKHWEFFVKLDGKKLDNCITADDELNECVIYKTDKSGNFIFNGTSLERETVKGKVEILSITLWRNHNGNNDD